MFQRNSFPAALYSPNTLAGYRRFVRGFTLIELLVVVSIVGILLLLAVNSYSSWLSQTRSEELSFDLQRSFSLARSMAIKHGGRVRLCGSSDGATCTNSFDRGWIIFQDIDNSEQVDGADTITRVFEHDSGVFTVTLEDVSGPTAITGVSFNYKGYADSSILATLSSNAITQSFTVNRNGNIQ